MSERLISRANRAMPSDSLASDCWNRSCALVRNTFCTSIAIGWVSGRLPAMSVNKKTTREPIAIASKKSPPHRVEWYRAFKIDALDLLASWRDEAMSLADPMAIRIRRKMNPSQSRFQAWYFQQQRPWAVRY